MFGPLHLFEVSYFGHAQTDSRIVRASGQITWVVFARDTFRRVDVPHGCGPDVAQNGGIRQYSHATVSHATTITP
jgi:hypothetical protein